MDRETVIRIARKSWQETGNGWTAQEWFDDRAASFERFAAAVEANCVPPGCALLYIGNGMFAKCDWSDWELVRGYWWRSSALKGNTRYAQTYDSHDTKTRKFISMHRLIMNPSKDQSVDHINGDGLDNRRENLRIVSHAQNMLNQNQHGGSSKFKGVSYRSDTDTWRAYISKSGKRTYLGVFATEVDAAKAYNNAAKELHGEYAKLNEVD